MTVAQKIYDFIKSDLTGWIPTVHNPHLVGYNYVEGKLTEEDGEKTIWQVETLMRVRERPDYIRGWLWTPEFNSRSEALAVHQELNRLIQEGLENEV